MAPGDAPVGCCPPLSGEEAPGVAAAVVGAAPGGGKAEKGDKNTPQTLPRKTAL